MKGRKNSSIRSYLTIVTAAAGIVATALIPPCDVLGIRLHRTVVLPGLIRFESDEAESIVEYEADIERLEEQLAAIEVEEPTVPQPAADTLAQEPPVQTRFEMLFETPVGRGRIASVDEIEEGIAEDFVPIEDFDTLPRTRFEEFIDRMVDGQPVRIAFMGDSFIEGDILTADLRDGLQRLFGGCGVGFVPCDIPFATSRKTVKRRSAGWDSYSIMKPKAAPGELRDLFFVSGYISHGGPGADTRWQTATAYPTLDSCTTARILLISRERSSIEVTLDDTLSRRFDMTGDKALREIRIDHPYRSVRMKIIDGHAVCYGITMESPDGVRLDNFSVRSNNGHAIFDTSPAINREVDAVLGGYDLVVLQYGLNIMQPSQRNYTRYRDQLRDMIAYARRCFPRAAVLVMGVSDRCVKNAQSGAYETVASAEALTAYQRAAADSCRVAFWDTRRAMQRYGGMKGFVSRRWAGGDYTHINYAGGRAVAQALLDAIRVQAAAARQELDIRQADEMQRMRIIAERYHRRDSIARAKVEVISNMVDTIFDRAAEPITETRQM